MTTRNSPSRDREKGRSNPQDLCRAGLCRLQACTRVHNRRMMPLQTCATGGAIEPAGVAVARFVRHGSRRCEARQSLPLRRVPRLHARRERVGGHAASGSAGGRSARVSSQPTGKQPHSGAVEAHRTGRNRAAAAVPRQSSRVDISGAARRRLPMHAAERRRRRPRCRGRHGACARVSGRSHRGDDRHTARANRRGVPGQGRSGCPGSTSCCRDSRSTR